MKIYLVTWLDDKTQENTFRLTKKKELLFSYFFLSQKKSCKFKDYISRNIREEKL